MPLHEAVFDAQMRNRVLPAAVRQAGVGIPKVGGNTSAEKNSGGQRLKSDSPDHNFCSIIFFSLLNKLIAIIKAQKPKVTFLKREKNIKSNQLPRENSVINSTDNVSTGAKPKETGCWQESQLIWGSFNF